MKDRKFPSSIEEEFFESEEEEEEEVATDEEEENQEELEDDDDQVEDDEDEKKTIFRVLREECVDCAYLIPWKENLEKCHTDLDCPARNYKFMAGRDPEKMARKLAMLLHRQNEIKADKNVKKEVKSFLKTISSRSDGLTILKRASDLIQEIEKSNKG